MAQKIVRDEVCYEPAKLFLKRHISYSYECDCHDPITEPKSIKNAPVPSALFPRSLVGPCFLAWVLYLKFVLSVPFYRQENDWRRLGFNVTRRTMSNWVILADVYYLSYIYNCLHNHLRLREILHGDETVYQILMRSDGKPATSEARMWVFRTTHQEETPIVLYHASLTRQKEVAKEVLGEYNGYLHCDAYSGYQGISGVTVVCCWAHTRRYFKDVPQPKGVTGTKAQTAIAYCDKMFKIERKLKDLKPEDRYDKRLELLKPVMDEFFSWLESFPVIKGKLQEAVNYALNHKNALMRVLEDGRLQLSNNICEQKVKPLVIGRKNYLFSTSEAGAKANATIYTLVETAKENGLDPYKYLRLLLERLPNLEFHRHPDLLEALLPWEKIPQEQCRAIPNKNDSTSVAS